MAALYTHKRHGWQVLYKIYFPDGTRKNKFRHYINKPDALGALQDLEKLELYSSKQTLTGELITYYLHSKYINAREAALLSSRDIPYDVLQQTAWDRLEELYNNHIASVGSASTRKSYPYKIRPILKYFEKQSPASLTAPIIREYIARRRETVSKATVNKEISALRVMLDHLVAIGVITENPARLIKRFSDLPEHLPRCFTPEEMKKILQKAGAYIACRGYFPEMIYAYLFTGMRRYELIHLKTTDIDFRKKLIRIRGKGDKDRMIDIHPALDKVFQSVFKKNKYLKVERGDYFFGGGLRPFMDENSVGRAFRYFLQEQGIHGNNSLHTLRHTFITYLLDSGVSIRKVQQIAGHSSMKTTFKYTHIVPSNERTVSRLDYNKYFPKKKGVLAISPKPSSTEPSTVRCTKKVLKINQQTTKNNHK
jgi:integrase/recombinase XerC